MIVIVYLFSGLQLFAVEAVEQQGQEEIEDHEVADHQGRQEDGQAGFGDSLRRRKAKQNHFQMKAALSHVVTHNFF